ncbi:sugar phosphate nucleotidyltransferase [Halovivax limisalsi]|uniref:sugar phosphate nucleotidyltransferase n=1 Tax=Halovivax limisalsi TaxID=1453760 RepID=UPI001FFCD6C8|nr:sugar phosphate nucleotidyltransferase [Halovivax limisalsi]
MHDTSAVVLAAGEGRRLRPLTRNRPKPMLPGATTPILEHLLDELIVAGVTDVTLVVGHARNRVQSHFGPTYRNVPLSYVTQETQLGTGHALLQAASAIDGPTLCVYGDQLVGRELIAAVRDGHDGAAATLGLLDHGDVSEYGGVRLEDGRVSEIVERPRAGRSYLLNAGVYVLDERVLDATRRIESSPGERSLVDAISRLLESNEPVTGVRSSGLWVDATYPWDLLTVADALFERGLVDGSAPAGDGPGGKSVDEARTDTASGVASERTGTDDRAAPVVHESAVLREPVAFGPDCEIGPGAVVGPSVAAGANATIESNAVVTDSVLDRDVRVGAGATLVECVAGPGVEIGTGSTVAGGPSDVRVGEEVATDVRLGAVLADRVRDGGGVTYAPGTVVGANAQIGPGTAVSGVVEAETEVRS